MFDALTGALRQGIRRSQALTEFLQSVQFEFEHPPDGPVILVHETTQAGSGPLLRALENTFPRANVYHTHYLNPDTIRGHHAQFTALFRQTGQAGVHHEFMAARTLASRLRAGVRSPWKIITLVRDPMARTISAFFRHFRLNHPGFEKGYEADPAHLDRLIQLFLADDEHERGVTLEWFDREVRDVFGIDVFRRPFPKDAGYDTYGSDTCAMLVLRTEDLDRVGARAIGSFLGIVELRIESENQPARAGYAAAYAEFVERIRMPTAYLDAMYGSRLARHFYSDAEIEAFRSRWVSG